MRINHRPDDVVYRFRRGQTVQGSMFPVSRNRVVELSQRRPDVSLERRFGDTLSLKLQLIEETVPVEVSPIL